MRVRGPPHRRYQCLAIVNYLIVFQNHDHPGCHVLASCGGPQGLSVDARSNLAADPAIRTHLTEIMSPIGGPLSTSWTVTSHRPSSTRDPAASRYLRGCELSVSAFQGQPPPGPFPESRREAFGHSGRPLRRLLPTSSAESLIASLACKRTRPRPRHWHCGSGSMAPKRP